MSNLKGIAPFLGGVVAGGAIAHQILKKRYEALLEEEIDSVREVFFEHMHEPAETAEVSPQVEETENYDEVISHHAYNTGAFPTNTERKEVCSPMDGPYIIGSDEFAELEGYDVISLTYYADGVLTDDKGGIVDDVEDVVGFEALNHFGEYENDPDSVYVRNDDRKCDYEILRDDRNYIDTVKNRVRWVTTDHDPYTG